MSMLPFLFLAAPSAVIAPTVQRQPDLPVMFGTVLTPEGEVVSDLQGRPLYTHQIDKPAGFSCTTFCAPWWSPVDAAPDAQPSGEWEPLKSQDGRLQWSFMKAPVYTFTTGGPPGLHALDGHGGDRWHIVHYLAPSPKLMAPGGVQAIRWKGHFLLADYRGRPLYTVKCKADCTGWTPLPVAITAHAVANWKIVVDGTEQIWAYSGKPIYTYDGDLAGADPAGLKLGAQVIDLISPNSWAWTKAPHVRASVQTVPESAGLW